MSKKENIVSNLIIRFETIKGYQLKELFLDMVNHTDYENCEEQILTWINLCRKSKIEEFMEN